MRGGRVGEKGDEMEKDERRGEKSEGEVKRRGEEWCVL